MNICFVCNRYQYHYFLSSHRDFLIRSGYNVIFVSLGDGTIAQRRGITGVIKGVLALLRLKFLGRADVILTFGVQAGLIATTCRVLSLGRWRTIVWVTGFSWETATGVQRFFRRSIDYINTSVASQILTDSVWQRNRIISEFAVDARILHRGSVCGARFGNDSTSFPLVQYEKKKKFVVVGRLCEAKGSLWLARAFSSTNIDVDFYGSLEFENNANEAEFLEILFNNANLTHRGVLPFDKIARDGYVLIAPSFREGLPMSIVDAQSFGMVVLGRDIEAHREVLVHTNEQNIFSSELELLELIQRLELAAVEPAKIASINNSRYSTEKIQKDMLQVIIHG